MKTYSNYEKELFIPTGEFRNPEIGEYFLYENTERVAKCCIGYLQDERRIIVIQKEALNEHSGIKTCP